MVQTRSCYSIELFWVTNLRFFHFNVQHMKLKAKSMMKSRFPGRGNGLVGQVVALSHSPGKGGSNPAMSEVGREGAVSPLHVSHK